MKTLKTLLMTLCLAGAMHTEAKTVILGVPQALESLKTGDELVVKDFRLVLTAAERAGAVKGWRAAIDGVECAAVYRGPSGWFVDINDFKNGRVYQVREDHAARSANAWTVTEADPNREPTMCLPPKEPSVTTRAKASVTRRSARSANDSYPRYIDLLYAFEAKAKKWVEQEKKMTLEEFAFSQIAKANGIIDNTDLGKKFHFRYAGTVSIAEECSDLETALDNVTKATGEWASIREARNRYGADIVCMMIDTGSPYGGTGLAWGLGVEISDPAIFGLVYAYNTVSVRAADIHYTGIHEIGHNLGCGHSDKQESGGKGPQWRSYSSGYYFTSFDGKTDYYTIMAYNYNYEKYYTQAPYFSSPEYTHDGKAVGMADKNDNNRTIRESYSAAVEWMPPRQSALGPSFDVSSGDFEDGMKMGDMTLHLNGNTTDASGAIVLGDAPVYLDTGLSFIAEAEGMEVTVVLTLDSVDTGDSGMFLSLDSLVTTDAVGVGFQKDGELCGMEGGQFPNGAWKGFGTYKDGKDRHMIALGYAAPEDGKGSGDYGGCVFAMDGAIVGRCESQVYSGQITGRINIGGFHDKTGGPTLKGARIKRIAVYTGAISEDRLKEATVPDGPTYDWVSYCSGVSYTSTPLAKDVTASRQMKVAFLGQFDASETSAMQLAYYNGDANDIYLKTDSSGELFLKMARKTTGDELKTMSGKKLTPGAHRFGLYVRRGPGLDGHEISIIATMDGEELARIGDGKLRFDTNPMRKWYFGDPDKPNNCYTAHYVEPEAAVAEDAKTVATLVHDVELLYPKGVEIVRDKSKLTWSVDTTRAAYAFTATDIGDLDKDSWKVTLRSASELGATIDFGVRTYYQAAHYVTESGTHTLRWLGGANASAANMQFDWNGKADDPSVLVKPGATLNFIAKDITGWLGDAKNKSGNLIRVNGGGTLNLLQDGSSTHYYQGRYWLDPGATVSADFSDGKFRLNGGATKGYEQLYVPDTTNGAPIATFKVSHKLNVANDATSGLGIFVGNHATLCLDADITSDGKWIEKWGEGLLTVKGSLADFTGTLAINAGALKLEGAAPKYSVGCAKGAVVIAGTRRDLVLYGDGLVTVQLTQDEQVPGKSITCFTREEGAISVGTVLDKDGHDITDRVTISGNIVTINPNPVLYIITRR